MYGGKSRVFKDGGGVECNDIDTAHLLGNHDGKRSEGCATDTRNRKQLYESGDIVALPNNLLLDLELSVDIV